MTGPADELDRLDRLDRIDRLLSTTRSVRRRLDFSRPVPDELVLECIDLAEQAPTGGNQSSRRWMILTDPELKVELADLYRRGGGNWMIEQAERIRGGDHPNERTMASAAHLAANLEHVPTLVLLTIHGEHDGSGRPGLFDSVIQAGWSFCLALRARDLGTAWTTAALNEADAVADLLGIPAGVTQIAMFPVAYTVGTTFRAAPRRPARDITWWNGWGLTSETAVDGELTLAKRPGVTLEGDIESAPGAGSVWEWLVPELEGATGRLPAVAAPSRVGRVEWAGQPESQAETWQLEMERIAGATRLRLSVRLGPGPSALSAAIAARPEDEAELVRRRLLHLRAAMSRALDQVADQARHG